MRLSVLGNKEAFPSDFPGGSEVLCIRTRKRSRETWSRSVGGSAHQKEEKAKVLFTADKYNLRNDIRRKI